MYIIKVAVTTKCNSAAPPPGVSQNVANDEQTDAVGACFPFCIPKQQMAILLWHEWQHIMLINSRCVPCRTATRAYVICPAVYVVLLEA